MKPILIIGLLFITTTSCEKNSPTTTAALKEAPDLQNLRGQFGIMKPLYWDEVKATTRVKLTKIPWTDTYWPLAEKETAARWENLNPSNNEEIGIATYLSTYASEAAKEEPSPLLSPAEKYDIVFQSRHDKKPTDEELNDLINQFKTVDESIRKTTDIATKRSLVSSMSDQLEASAVFTGLTLTSHAWNEFLTYSSDSEFKYLNNSSYDGQSWGWMGICHGWAPAAVMSGAPKHAVLAEIADKKVLFTPGDIRGLLSRSWAQQAPDDKQYFLGRRCNLDVEHAGGSIASNANGRGYAGSVTTNGAKVGFTIIDSLLDLNVKVYGRKTAVFKIQMDDKSAPKFLLESMQQRYYLVSSFADLVAYVKTSDMTRISQVEAEISGCWDVNPASFHEVLVEQLGKRDVGFVMDRTRTGQVWNQPVYAAEFTISELKRRDEVKDIAAAYRSSGAVYVAEVTADVHWIGEPGDPSLNYPPGFDLQQSETSNYTYTLEFDADKKLIGGEWGTLTSIDPSDNAPDFLFGYEKGAEPTDHLESTQRNASIDYTGIVKALFACSQSDTIDGEKVVASEKFPYSRCPISTLSP